MKALRFTEDSDGTVHPDGQADESLAEYIDHSLDRDHAEKARWREVPPLPPGSPWVI